MEELVPHALFLSACWDIIRHRRVDSSGSAAQSRPESVLDRLRSPIFYEFKLSLHLTIVLFDCLSDLASLSDFVHVGVRSKPSVKL